MKQRLTRCVTMLVCTMALLLLVPIMALAAEETGLSEQYSNRIVNTWPTTFGECRTSFLGKLQDGGYQTVIYDSGMLYIENFDSGWNSVWKKTVGLELPVWGGVYLGDAYNYVVCGQGYDPELEDGGEVYRVIKYDKEFRRIGSVSFTSSDTYTTTPFAAGNVSVAEHENVLTVYTSRLRLDGHQSNIALRIRTEDMTVYDHTGMVSFPDMHTSHSFRQIVKYDGDAAVYADLADAYPVRSVYLQYGKKGVPLIRIPGENGYNVTDADVSGLEISDSHYFTVGTYLNFSVQNVFLSAVDKASGEAESIWLTSATAFDNQTVYAPRIVKLSDSRFVVMWNVLQTNAVRYVILDQAGNIVCAQKEVSGIRITDCEPIFSDGKIIWLSVENGRIKTEELTDFTETGTYEWTLGIVYPDEPWDGTADTGWYDSGKTEFYLSTPQQLAGLSELSAAGNTFAGKTVYLANDIFMNDIDYACEWTPIQSWEGTFNGNGHTIYNIYQTEGTGGLFHTVQESGIVKAVDIAQSMICVSGGGSVADINKGIIAFCNNYSLVCGDNTVGGICRANYNLVYGCKNYGNVMGGEAGGIVGNNAQTLSVVSQCSNWGSVAALHAAAGIAESNYGWVYNCYSKGVIADNALGNPNNAKYIAGIVRNGSTYRAGDIESCYSICDYHAISALVYPIAYSGDIVNCYTDFGRGEDGVTVLTAEQMKDASFVDFLNRQTNTMLPAWVADTYGINDGYPITVADDNYQKGIYKIQPELWIYLQGTVTMKQGDSVLSLCESYYNEEKMIITLSDSSVAKFELEDGDLTVTALKAGETYLNIHFNETENVIAADYQVKIVVEGSSDPEQTIHRGDCGENAVWSFDEATGILLINGEGEMDSYYSIMGTYAPWYEYRDQITAIHISASITEIGAEAFRDCVHVTKITIPASVVQIGGGAFANCTGLTTVVCTDGLTEIASYAFSHCENLSDISFPNTLYKIGYYAFEGCRSLMEVTFPQSLEIIGEYAFDDCTGLKTIVFLGSMPRVAHAYGDTVGPVFVNVTADAYYPANNSSWLATNRDYGGNITWHAACEYHVWSDWMVVTEATVGADGMMARTCSACGLQQTESIPAGPPSFIDVYSSDFYYDPVMWAVERGITNGYGSSTTFCPNVECTRGQVVTFLWRAAGEPEPVSAVNPFVDVNSTDYYYKAVRWAVEKGITAGYGSADIFNPGGICTRGQVATFLHRYFGEPAPSNTANPFKDVAPGEFYHTAVLWAVEQGITNGYGADDVFNPSGNCTRGQIVTFLYRALT